MMHIFVFGHLTLRRDVALHVIGGQPTSSVLFPSWQSMTPLQRFASGMHLKSRHWNSVSVLLLEKNKNILNEIKLNINDFELVIIL